MLQMYAMFPEGSGGSYYSIASSGLVGAVLTHVTPGAYAWYNVAVRLPTTTGGNLTFHNQTNHSCENDLEIAALRLSVGTSFGRFPRLTKALNTVSRASAAPTGGTWTAGDSVYNTAPAASGSIGWVYTTGGTWKTFGTISA